MIVTPSRLLAHIDKSDLAFLQEKRFVATLGFDDSGTKTPIAAIEEASAGFRLNFDYEFMRPLDKDDAAAGEVLGRLAMLLSSPGVYTQYELSSGDSLCFRNGLALHRRGGFKPDFTYTRTLFRVLSGNMQRFPDAPLVRLTSAAEA